MSGWRVFHGFLEDARREQDTSRESVCCVPRRHLPSCDCVGPWWHERILVWCPKARYLECSIQWKASASLNRLCLGTQWFICFGECASYVGMNKECCTINERCATASFYGHINPVGNAKNTVHLAKGQGNGRHDERKQKWMMKRQPNFLTLRNAKFGHRLTARIQQNRISVVR